jgi:hypothetical protein
MHLIFRFFGMQPLETFACYDSMKNPEIGNDFRRFDAHLDEWFRGLATQPAWRTALDFLVPRLPDPDGAMLYPCALP